MIYWRNNWNDAIIGDCFAIESQGLIVILSKNNEFAIIDLEIGSYKQRFKSKKRGIAMKILNENVWLNFASINMNVRYANNWHIQDNLYFLFF